MESQGGMANTVVGAIKKRAALLPHANPADPGSLSNRLRNRRFQRFAATVNSLCRPVNIIDIGGTNEFWEQRGWAGRPDVTITVVNLIHYKRLHKNIKHYQADATNLSQIGDREFDVAFSNSVIEHLYTFDKQKAMAAEVRRIAKAYWVQTPNYWFPIEPHFLFLGWQYLPECVRIFLIKRRRIGWRGHLTEHEQAVNAVKEVRLMSRKELRKCFPDATLIPEKFCGMVKSWTACKGFGDR